MIAATHEVWHLIDPWSRTCLLKLWRDQIPHELGRYIETQGSSIMPVSVAEAREELEAWRRLWAWCEEQA